MSGGVGKANRALCGQQDPSSYTYARRGSRIVLSGAVRPIPNTSSWHVQIRIRRCVGKSGFGPFRQFIAGKGPKGVFRYTVSVPLPAGVFTVRAYYNPTPHVEPHKVTGKGHSKELRLIVR